MIGPMTDTPLQWFSIGDKPAFKAVLGGYPRQIVGTDKAELESLAERMKRGER